MTVSCGPFTRKFLSTNKQNCCPSRRSSVLVSQRVVDFTRQILGVKQMRLDDIMRLRTCVRRHDWDAHFSDVLCIGLGRLSTVEVVHQKCWMSGWAAPAAVHQGLPFGLSKPRCMATPLYFSTARAQAVSTMANAGDEIGLLVISLGAACKPEPSGQCAVLLQPGSCRVGRILVGVFENSYWLALLHT